MLQVNLLPWRQWQRLRRLSNAFCVVTVLIMLIVPLFIGWQWYLQDDIATNQRTLAALAHQRQALAHQQSLVDKAEASLLLVQQRREQSLQQYRRSLRYLNLLQAVSTAIPDEVWLTQLHEHDGKLMLSGLSLDYPQLLAFSKHLQSFGVLEHITLHEVSQLPTQRLRFVIRANLSEQDNSPLAEYGLFLDRGNKEPFYARILSSSR
ncbi:PilN domain-containing protein [Rouxiella sp. Mn2063]|uniref:PilN domain-containing protein n=1 Tax=Rouxiella sp. Mn2063 TaxID=3395262 RepID=UPI003BE2AAE5